MELRVQHTTRYTYSSPARSNINELRLSPDETERQKPGDHLLKVTPITEFKASRDTFGNLIHIFEVEDSHEELVISSEAEVETHCCRSKVDAAYQTPFDLKAQKVDEWSYSFTTDSGCVKVDPDIWREAVDIQHEASDNWGNFIDGMSRTIFEQCEYRDQVLNTLATASEIRERKFGTCQDFSHLMLGYCRALKIPARYISGYLYDPGLEQQEDAAFIGSEFSHAWVEVMVPDVGWVGIDPT
ncbi:MAG: transglutaminase family protein, partial [Verrucomicrobiota bacterium]